MGQYSAFSGADLYTITRDDVVRAMRASSCVLFALVVVVAAVVLTPLTGEVGGRVSTIAQHVRFARLLAEGELNLYHKLFFQIVNILHTFEVPREVGAILFLSICVSLVAFFTWLYLTRTLGGIYSTAAICGITAITLLVNALYIPFFSEGVYLGQWGPNVYHNATHITVLAFAVPLFCVVGDLAAKPDVPHYWTRLTIASALLFASVYAKPTLFQIIAPAATIYTLWKQTSISRCIITLTVLLIPAAVYVAYVYIASYNSEGSLLGGRTTAIAPFEVWTHWSRSVPISLIITFAFPLAFLVSAARSYRFGRYLPFAWLLVLVAFIQAALFVEVQVRTNMHYMSANWFGGYLLANHLLFVVTIGEFFGWSRTLDDRVRRSFRVRLCQALLALHLISGVVYLVRLRYVPSWLA